MKGISIIETNSEFTQMFELFHIFKKLATWKIIKSPKLYFIENNEYKNTPDELNSGFNIAEEKINELKGTTIETIQNEIHRDINPKIIKVSEGPVVKWSNWSPVEWWGDRKNI